jgi:ElaB/YqjD/DUF883 family membrane-anchored ribosome-binding protein
MSNTEHTGSRVAATTDYEAALNDITERGVAAIRGAKAGVEEVAADIGEKGREAMQGARDVRDTLANTLLDSIKTRPYTTLAIAGLIGFAYGALRRR